MIIKAIETKYKGYRFRSRLEARWAVFFDVLGVKWEYEPEGFDLSEEIESVGAHHDRYKTLKQQWDVIWESVLDSTCPGARDELQAFEETHGFSPHEWQWDDEDVEWLRNFHGRYLPDFYLPCLDKYVEIKPYQGQCFWGRPEHSPIRLLGGLLVHGMPGDRDEYEVCTFDDAPYWFGFCPVCKTFGYGFCAWAERICPSHEKCGHWRKEDLDSTRPFVDAITSARSARFEHGETPK